MEEGERGDDDGAEGSLLWYNASKFLSSWWKKVVQTRSMVKLQLEHLYFRFGLPSNSLHIYSSVAMTLIFFCFIKLERTRAVLFGENNMISRDVIARAG